MRTTIPAIAVAVAPLPRPGFRLELVVELDGGRTARVPLTTDEAAQLRRDGVDAYLGHGCRYDAGSVTFPNGATFGRREV